MLEFINNNGVLFSGIFSVIVALISVIVSIIGSSKKNKNDTIHSLKSELEKTHSELAQTKEELSALKDLELADKQMEKTHGSIYYEKLPDGKFRTICGFCWEREHLKIPIVVNTYYDDEVEKYVNVGVCHSCKNRCEEYFLNKKESEIIEKISGELPF